MFKRFGAIFALMLATAAHGQTVGGGSHVYQDWFPLAAPVTVTPVAPATSYSQIYPAMAQTAWFCNRGAVDANVNPFGQSIAVTASAASYVLPANTCRVFNLNPYASQYTWFAYYSPTGTPPIYLEVGIGSPPITPAGNPAITVTANITPAQSASGYAPVTIGTSDSIISSATPTAFLDIVNDSLTATICIRFGAPATMTVPPTCDAGEITIPPPLWHRSWEGSGIITAPVHAIASAAGTPAAVKAF